MDGDAVAFSRSASGPGAGAFLENPLDDRWAMADSRFRTACHILDIHTLQLLCHYVAIQRRVAEFVANRSMQMVNTKSAAHQVVVW